MQSSQNKKELHFKFNFYELVQVFIGMIFVQLLMFILLLLFPILQENVQVRVCGTFIILETISVVGCMRIIKTKFPQTQSIAFFLGVILLFLQEMSETFSWFGEDYLLKLVYIFLGTVGIVLVHVLLFLGFLMVWNK